MIHGIREVVGDAAAEDGSSESHGRRGDEEAARVGRRRQVHCDRRRGAVAHVEAHRARVGPGLRRHELEAHGHPLPRRQRAARGNDPSRPAELGRAGHDLRLADDAVVGGLVDQLVAFDDRDEDPLRAEIHRIARQDRQLAGQQVPADRRQRHLHVGVQPVVRLDHQGGVRHPGGDRRERDPQIDVRPGRAHRHRATLDCPSTVVAVDPHAGEHQRHDVLRVHADVRHRHRRGARRAERGRPNEEGFRQRLQHRADTGAGQTQDAGAAVGRAQRGLGLLSAQVLRVESRRAADRLSGREGARRLTAVERRRQVRAPGERDRFDCDGALADIGDGERLRDLGGEPELAEVEGLRLHQQQLVDALAGERDRSRRAGRTGRDRDGRAEAAETVRAELQAHHDRLLGRQDLLAPGVDGEHPLVQRRRDRDRRLRPAVAIGHQEVLRGRLVHHHRAEIERVAGERCEPAHRVTPQVDVGPVARGRVGDDLQHPLVRAEPWRPVADGDVHRAAGTKRRGQSFDLERRVGELRELSDGHGDEARVPQDDPVRLLPAQRDVSEIERGRRDGEDPAQGTDVGLACATARRRHQHACQRPLSHSTPPGNTTPGGVHLHAPCQGPGGGACACRIGKSLPSRGSRCPGGLQRFAR